MRVLSGGAARGLVERLAGDFEAETGHAIAGDFGAVGAMRERFVGGEPADLVILTRPLIEALAADGRLDPASIADVGAVETAIAVKEGAPAPAVGDGAALRTALLAAEEVFLPDPQRATAGIHFAAVLSRLGIAETLAPRLRPHPNGATAMAAMARAARPAVIGCTQASEIIAAEGVALVAPLPPGFDLAATYTAAVIADAAEPDAARRLLALLTADESEPLRRACGMRPAVQSAPGRVPAGRATGPRSPSAG